MTANNPPPARAARLADRLATARRGRFVGRMAELGLFRAAVLEFEPPPAVLHMHGPGGVGKTTLLREFARIATDCGRPVVRLDGRHFDPTPGRFLEALRQAMGFVDDPDSRLQPELPEHCVLLIDTYEVIEALDDWLRDEFLPRLPAGSLTVIVGRNTPAPAWRTDAGWADLTHIISLGNLSREESETYLAARGISSTHHAAALGFTSGHPLALALVADTLQRGGNLTAFDPGSAPDLVGALLERLVREIPSAAHRRALDACVLARTTTEDLIASVPGIDDPHECFEWLRWQSFIEHGPHGIFPHDLARDVLLADLRWRNPEEFDQLVRQLWMYLLYRRIIQTSGAERQRLQLDSLYVMRAQPMMAPYYDWTAMENISAKPLASGDAGAIIDMVRRHEGPASAEIAAHWLARQPEAFLVFRDRDLDRFGFMTNLALDRVTPDDADIDPAVSAALRFIACHGPLASDEEALHLRYWMHRDSYQEATAAANLMVVNIVTRWVTSNKLAWSFVSMADPEFWTPHLASANFPRVRSADFEVGGRCYGVFAHDWRIEPASDWMTPRGTPMPFGGEPDAGPAASQALSEAEFAAAVHQALRDYAREDRLATSPLLAARLIQTAGRDLTPVAALKRILREAVGTLAEHPRDVKFHRAVWHTYIEPAPTQERAAELLDLPFNTYRYQLARGIERIISHLWLRETGDSAP